jgi:hypothetical protein
MEKGMLQYSQNLIVMLFFQEQMTIELNLIMSEKNLIVLTKSVSTFYDLNVPLQLFARETDF